MHLSDFHFSKGWSEEQGVVLQGFFDDFEKQKRKNADADFYLIFSGDLVAAGNDNDSYDEFYNVFNPQLNRLDIPYNKRICVPGNHDIATEAFKTRKIEHEGIISQKLNERDFNDFFTNPNNILSSKFDKYLSFEKKFASYGIANQTATGTGWTIGDNIGVYCLNSALCSLGEVPSYTVHPDKGRLAVNTRDLHTWNQNCNHSLKVLIMHHPLNWLTPWAESELSTILKKDFSLFLCGHSHDQSEFHSINNGYSFAQCSAPPLFTDKKADLGYSLISFDQDTGVTEVAYRQWTKHQSFVTGTSFSNTDDGKVVIKGSNEAYIERILQKRLEDALVSFAFQPRLWIEPVLAKQPEFMVKNGDDIKIDIADLVLKPKHAIVKAPPQFGLTCLSLYLAKEAWRSRRNNFWLYLNSKNIPPSYPDVKKAIDNELVSFGYKIEEVKCVLLDSWINNGKESMTLLKNVVNLANGAPVIILETLDMLDIGNETEQILNDINFEVLYLRSLTRNLVRKVVNEYNETRHVGNVDAVVNKVVSDLEVLNLHRTPLNCLTLLKVSEIDFDESPVNRTEMLKRVLFLIFNTELPTYKSRPDLKDCEYVLGFFCETMLRNSDYTFTREYFLKVLEEFCKSRVIDLEVEVVFDVLYKNNILIRYGSVFGFRFSYWIYYFAAHRMQDDKQFADFIFANARYANYPEVIEFYTGIDRRREDALRTLIKDIQLTRNIVLEKIGQLEGLNPYRFGEWKPSGKALDQMHEEINEKVKYSNLPDFVKDQYADRTYQPSLPYYQEIRNILQEHSLVIMMQTVRAASRALRNSDYVPPDTKSQLLDEIIDAWEQLLKILIILTPLLAKDKEAVLQGQHFSLVGGFSEQVDQRFNQILCSLPENVVMHFKDDLYSRKMGPLLINKLEREDNELKKHELILLIIKQKPRNWKNYVHKYIESLPKNSFYLMDVYTTLRTEYEFSFVSNDCLREIKFLIITAAAKHISGSTGEKARNKVPTDQAIPERKVDI